MKTRVAVPPFDPWAIPGIPPRCQPSDPEVKAYKRLKAELDASNDVVGPISADRKSRALDAAGLKFSETVYGTPGGPRRLADQILLGKMGRHLSRVYFIGRGQDGPVKIGVAHDPAARRHHLQIGSPEELYLLAAIRGDFAVERMLHGVFSPDHIRGEWFRRSHVLAEVIGHLTKPARFQDG